jgi:hypothetical protein
MREFSTHLIMNYLFSLLVPNNLLLEPEVGIVQLISYLRELFTRLSMIQSHAESTF